VVAVLRGRLPARARAGTGPDRGERSGRRLRLRPLPRDRGRSLARDLLGRYPAGAVLAAARLPARTPRAGARRLARVRVAGEPRLHAGTAVLLPAARAGGARAVARLARSHRAGQARAAAWSHARADVRRRGGGGPRRGVRGAPLREGLA